MLRGLLVTVALAGVPVVAATAPAAATGCQYGKTQYVDTSSYAIASLGAPQSWPLATGKGVTVAVVDSGVDDHNAHLSGAVLPGGSFVGGDPTGRVDKAGHGTGVAGIIAARPLTGSKLVGEAPDAKILPVRVFQYDSIQGRTVPYPPDGTRIAQGIRWAVQNHADVINVSMSSPATDPAVPAIKAAVALAHRHNVVVVASGGNYELPQGQTNAQPTTALRYPAAAPHVIGVAASNAQGEVDDWSIHGPQNDVAAPGANVLITFFANGDCLAGDKPYTSWAAGFVSGLAAQLRQRFPHESADQIAYRITASADRPRLFERTDTDGGGEIRPYDALTMTLDPNRPGPPLPGAAHQVTPPAPRSPVTPLAVRTDPLAPTRARMLWWALGATGLGALALVLRPWVGRLASSAGSRRRTSTPRL